MSTLEEQEVKAKAMYDAERAKLHNPIDVMEEARSAIARNTEPWYYTGNQLLGRLDSVIAMAWDGEYQEYVSRARAQGVKEIYTLEQYKEVTRNLPALTQG